MKRDITFKLNKVVLDYKTKPNKELEKRIGLDFKLLGRVEIGRCFEMYFEDGFVHKTTGLEIEGYINQYDKDDNLRMVTLCTKDICYEFLISEKKELEVEIIEQLTLL